MPYQSVTEAYLVSLTLFRRSVSSNSVDTNSPADAANSARPTAPGVAWPNVLTVAAAVARQMMQNRICKGTQVADVTSVANSINTVDCTVDGTGSRAAVVL